MRTLALRLALAWLASAGLLIACLYPRYAAGGRALKLTDWFLFRQDLPVLWAITAAAFIGLGVSLALPRGGERPTPPSLDARRAAIAAGLLALACGLLAWAGTFVVFDGYALSMDEFMANFDAAILAHGALMAPLAPPWRGFVFALQPTFVTLAPGDVAWSSQYLPVNAALRAVGVLAGAPALVSAIVAAVSVAAVFAVARRLWPARPDLAVVAAVLLATSSQFLLTAMTAYAMTAHLAFDLVWLWLFLRGGKLAHTGAILTGFLATGLHQFIFHPLFVAPFIAELLLARRWRLAATYIAAYAVICAFWVGYWRFAFAFLGQTAAPVALGAAAAKDLASRLTPLLAAFDPAAIRVMDANLIRFATWQSLLTAPLAVLGAIASIRAGGPVRALALGFVLSAVALFVILPHQGHGWGYRYWHGLLGSAVLLAAFAWGRLSEGIGAAGRRAANAVFAIAAAVSLFVLLPLRASQVHAFVHPYARAWAAIASTPAQVVIVDPVRAWYAADLVRNDPWLRRAPRVFDIRELSGTQLAALCRAYSVQLFDAADARAFGIKAASLSADDADLPPAPDRLRAAGCPAER